MKRLFYVTKKTHSWVFHSRVNLNNISDIRIYFCLSDMQVVILGNICSTNNTIRKQREIFLEIDLILATDNSKNKTEKLLFPFVVFIPLF